MSAESSAASVGQSSVISTRGRSLILIFAFLGWGFSGVHMAFNGIVMRVASAHLLESQFVEQGIADSSVAATNLSKALLEGFDDDENGTLDDRERGRAREASLSQWFGWLTCAFLFGAAAGGYVFGVLGDRFGRAKAMAASIFCYSLFSAATYFVQNPTQLLVLRFLTCMGIGGMWPNGIALLSEAWPGISRPFLAGAIGTAANVGILCFALYTVVHEVRADDWRWTFLVGASPVVLGVLSLLLVPESPRWLALRSGRAEQRPQLSGLGEIFRPPLLKTTLLGILLGTIPLFGGWGVSNWASAWASEVGDTAKISDPILKSMTVIARSLPGSISSLLGGCLGTFARTPSQLFLAEPVRADLHSVPVPCGKSDRE